MVHGLLLSYLQTVEYTMVNVKIGKISTLTHMDSRSDLADFVICLSSVCLSVCCL